MKPLDVSYIVIGLCINVPMSFVHMYYMQLVSAKKGWSKPLLAAHLLLGLTNTLFFMKAQSFYLFTGVVHGVYACYSHVVYRHSWKESLFYTILFYFLTYFIVLTANWISGNVTGDIFLHYGATWETGVIGCLAIVIICFGIVHGFRKRLQFLAGYRLSMAEFWNIVLIAVPLLYFCHSQELMAVDAMHLPIEMVVVRCGVSLSAAFALMGVIGMNKSQAEQVELARIEGLLNKQYEQFRLKKESSELIMARCHDLQKQLRMFETTQKPEYLEQYRLELQKTIDDYDALYETGNAIIDTLLSDASLKCRKDQVQLICLLDGREFDFINAMDLCTIFGNALDNAIESVCRIAEPEKRIVHVKGSADKGLVLLRVDNYYEHELHWEENELMTSKEEGSGHGYGLKSIRYAVEKYGGYVRTQAEDGRFVLTISLPKP